MTISKNYLDLNVSIGETIEAIATKIANLILTDSSFIDVDLHSTPNLSFSYENGNFLLKGEIDFESNKLFFNNQEILLSSNDINFIKENYEKALKYLNEMN